MRLRTIGHIDRKRTFEATKFRIGPSFDFVRSTWQDKRRLVGLTRQLARQTDKATFILPCGTHEIKARTDTEFGRLEGSLSVDMTDRSKTHVYAISLSSAN